jgi:hypothetical protein
MKLSIAMLSLMSVTSVIATNRGAKKEVASPLRRKLGMDDKNSMGGMGGGGGCAVADGFPPVEETADDSLCTICDQNNKIKPSSLTLIYNPEGKNSAYQDGCKATCRAGTYPDNPIIIALDKKGNTLGAFSNVSVGQSFTVDAPVGDSLDSITNFQISGWNNDAGGDDCFIHTSCSQPLVVGDQIGPFVVSAGNDCIADPPTAPPVASIETLPPTPEPTTLPPTQLPTTLSPTQSPTLPPCIEADKTTYECGEDITVKFNFAGSVTPADPFIDDWVGIYPCDVVQFKHAEVWEWTCAAPPANPLTCTDGPASEGVVLFDQLNTYNNAGPHTWPIAPFYTSQAADNANRCFKAVLLRNEGPSTPPYVSVCESASFVINENGNNECAIRASSPSFGAQQTTRSSDWWF